MTATTLHIDILPERFAVARLDGQSRVPDWSSGAHFSSITRSPTELSIVCEESQVPGDITAQRGFRCLRVRGPLHFDLVGVLRSIADPLARAEVSIFALSTYDTDYILVPSAELEPARMALIEAGHTVGPAGAA